MTEKEKARGEFEVWYKDICSPFVCDISRDTDPNSDQFGQYIDSAVDLGWTVWELKNQVIESQRREIEELQRRLDAASGDMRTIKDHADFVMESLYDSMTTDEERKILCIVRITDKYIQAIKQSGVKV